MSTIIYADSSVVARCYLTDEVGHAEAQTLLGSPDPDVAFVTGTWTRVEVTAALARAGRQGRCNTAALLRVFAADISPDGPITVLAADQGMLEARATEIVQSHQLRALDALHIAVAEIAVAPYLNDGDVRGFATRDADQSKAAVELGYQPY